ncbi:L-lactate permease [Nonomuraea sp. NPDC049695]|uniref:L-lactate permease n=1 Tax=Nonomuraea sp. NPDC049695 TaxID=3154734 RepID=UPI0034133270
MYQQNFNPTGSLWLSALLAALPLIAVLVLLGVFRARAHWAGLAGLAIGLVIAVLPFAYAMPVGQALDAGLYGAARAVLLILWITFNAIWIYKMTERSGHFAVLRRAFQSVSDDRRITAIVIAFSFGALIEALAGGGSPIAICAVMLIALGFEPMRAAVIALIANTAPVAFGGMGNPITILGSVTELPPEPFGAMAGRQTAFIALLVPFIIVFIADGRRGLRQAWPAALVAGVSFGAAQLLFSQFNYRLTDIFAALVSAVVLVAFGKVWRPAEKVGVVPTIAGGSVDDPAFVRLHGRPGGDTAGDRIAAFAPYVIIIVLFSIAQLPAVKDALARFVVKPVWPGLHLLNPAGKPVQVVYELPWAAHPGTLLFVSGLLTMLALRIGPGSALRTYGATVRQFGWAIVTILAVFALAFVMQFSGQIQTLGLFLAGAGAFFAFLSPVVGWFGVAITGTDAGANALFAKLQTTAAGQLGVPPELFGAANSSGGVMGKMISPQNLAIGTAAAGMVGEEGNLFRRVIGWSAVLLLILCVLVFLQSTPVLGWLIPSR